MFYESSEILTQCLRMYVRSQNRRLMSRCDSKLYFMLHYSLPNNAIFVFFLLVYHGQQFQQIHYLQALDLIRGKNVLLLMDSSMEGQYANDDATKFVELASKCLQAEARDRPDSKFLLSAVSPLQKKKEVASKLSFDK